MVLTGEVYRVLAVSAFRALNARKEQINQMNVFPVPDGDTGINMSLTMSTLAEVAENLPLSVCAAEIADRMLRAARGNSGAILSLFFRGVAKAFAGKKGADALELSSAFACGAEETYRAVLKPTEGTVLTVMRASAEAARRATEADAGISLQELLTKAVDAARETLQKTPQMLSVLKDAGVVDAGGFGFLTCLEGMLAASKGLPIKVFEQAVPAAADFSDFYTADIAFAYCTECVVEKSERYFGEDTASDLRMFIHSIGDSAVFVDEERLIKLHVHTNDPGAVLSYAVRYGELSSVKIENMRHQHTALAQSENAKQKERLSLGNERGAKTKRYGFISVCMGKGIGEVFYDLGVDKVVEGGQTMNPSTQNIIDAVLGVDAQTVFILPNNKNVCMVARQAAELVKQCRALVVPTETIPEGISAMLAVGTCADAEEQDVLLTMKDAYTGVTGMAVTAAVRDTVIGRFRIESGQYLGLVENVIACVGKTRRECIAELTRGMAGAAFVTLFYGESVSREEGEWAATFIKERLGEDCEVTVVAGGQPVYDYIVSVEQASAI